MPAFNVTSCTTCPFFQRSLLSVLAGGDGDCACDPGRVPAKKLPIARGVAATVPKWCPLRLGDHVVTINEGN